MTTQKDALVSVLKAVDQMTEALKAAHDTIEIGEFSLQDYPEIVLVDQALSAARYSLDIAATMLERTPGIKDLPTLKPAATSEAQFTYTVAGDEIWNPTNARQAITTVYRPATEADAYILAQYGKQVVKVACASDTTNNHACAAKQMADSLRLGCAWVQGVLTDGSHVFTAVVDEEKATAQVDDSTQRFDTGA